jgi:hypothetical protein
MVNPGIQSTRMDILPHMRISTGKKSLPDQTIFAFQVNLGIMGYVII